MDKNTNTIGDTLREGLGDVISDEMAEKITAMFDEAVAHEVEEKIQLRVETELERMDEQHAEELEKLLESIDTDHLNKTRKLMEAMDENYSKKLVAVANKYNRELDENAKEFNKKLTESISTFLDQYLDEALPAETIKEAVENTKARHILAEIKNVIGIDPAFISEGVKSAVMDAKEEIDSLRSQLEGLVSENKKLSNDLSETQTKLVLEQKTYGLPAEKRDFVIRRLSDRSIDDIEANYNYVCEMYDADQRDSREKAKVAAEAKSETISKKVDRPRVKITENVEDKNRSSSDFAVQSCLEGLMRQKH